MLFKISDGKEQNPDLPENTLTFARTHLPNLEIQMDNMKNKRTRVSNKWLPCLMSTILIVVLLSVVVTILIYMKAFNGISGRFISGQVCHYRHQTGNCLAKGYCCGGHYAIGKDVCSGNGLCCFGSVTKCKDTKSYDYWSFSSLMEISSKIVYRNVSEQLVEQAIVFSVSALEEREFYDQMSEKIGEDMTAATGRKWLAVCGNKDSFDLSLDQFSGYIVITINELEVILLRLPDLSELTAPMLESMRFPFPSSENHQNIPSVHSSEVLIDREYGVDEKCNNPFHYPSLAIPNRPSIEIIRSEVNASTQEIVIQTIDYVLSACLNNYGCVSHKLVEALNQQMPSSGSHWHCVVGADTLDHQLVVDIEYLNGFLLDVIFNNKHRILVYKSGVQTKTSELEVIRSGRRALALNKTVIFENNPSLQEHRRDAEQRILLESISRAVMTSDKYRSICEGLTSEANKNPMNYGCVAGPLHGFDYSIGQKLNRSFIGIKMNELFIILFRDRLSKILP